MKDECCVLRVVLCTCLLLPTLCLLELFSRHLRAKCQQKEDEQGFDAERDCKARRLVSARAMPQRVQPARLIGHQC